MRMWRPVVRAGMLVVVLALAAGTASAASLLSDYFDVTLQLDLDNGHTDTLRSGNPTSYPFLASSLDPGASAPTTVDYAVDDWHGSWSDTFFTLKSTFPGWPTGTTPEGGEPYDVEAIYFDDDPNNLYMVVVTSFDPPPGRTEDRASGDPLIVSGDLGLDFGLNPAHSPDNFSYDYGVNLNYEDRGATSSDDATSGGTTIGNELYRTGNSDWYVGTPTMAIPANGELTNFDPDWGSFSGTQLGTVTTDYYKQSFFDGETEVFETLYETYIIEVTIPRSLFGENNPGPGDTIGLAWVEGCRNDGATIIRIFPEIDTPEPSSLALLGFGVFAAGWMKRRSYRAKRRDA